VERAGTDPLAVSSRIGRDIVWTVAGAIAILLVVRFLSPVILPVVFALFIASLLAPVAARLERRMKRSTACLTALLAGIVVFALVVLLAVIPFARELSSVVDSAQDGIAELTQEADEQGLIDSEQAEEVREKVLGYAADIGAALLRGIAGGISTVASIGATLFLTLPLVFFLLKDGSRGWALIVSRLPGRRADLDRAGRQSFTVLSAFLRGTAIVATFDATVVAIGLWLIGVPLILPLAVLTFILAFIPMIGAILAGMVAALVALAAGDVGDALWVVALSLLVNQLEGVLVSPFAIGRAVSLHPAAVLLAVTGGASIIGITGAFLAVPILAVTLTFIRVLWPMEIPLELQR
jgi:predicted PurR-regulated permease PerM